MISSSQIKSDWNSIKSILETYQSEIDGLSVNWNGPSHDSLVQKSQTFLEEYTNTLGEQMNSFYYAVDLYEQYKIAKKNLEITKQNYNIAISNKDSSAASRFSSQLGTLRSKIDDLKSQIEFNLKVASATKLTASRINTGSIIIPSNEESSQTTNTNSFEVYNNYNNTNNYGASSETSNLSYVRSSGYASSGTPAISFMSKKGSTSVTTQATKTSQNIDYGNLDMTNYPKGSSKEDGLARAVLVAKYLVENGGFTKEQAAALVGVYLDENNCNPGSYMSAEKSGKGVKGTGGSGYGAGIASWTFSGYKKQCLADAGYSTNTPIESLSLQQQCDMIIAMSQKSNKKYYDALKRCNTIEDASATAYIITGGVGASKNWNTHPTQAEAKALSNKYGKNNDARYGKSSYHWNSDQRRLANAKQIYQYL